MVAAQKAFTNSELTEASAVSCDTTNQDSIESVSSGLLNRNVVATRLIDFYKPGFEQSLPYPLIFRCPVFPSPSDVIVEAIWLVKYKLIAKGNEMLMKLKNLRPFWWVVIAGCGLLTLFIGPRIFGASNNQKQAMNVEKPADPIAVEEEGLSHPQIQPASYSQNDYGSMQQQMDDMHAEWEYIASRKRPPRK